MEEYTQCEIWGTPAKDNYRSGGREILSPRAGGPYFIAGTGQAVFVNYDDHYKAHLTSWLVEQRRLGNKCPELNLDTMKAAKQWKDLSASERADNTLRYLAGKTKVLGSPVPYRIFDVGDDSQLDNKQETYLELLAHSCSVGNRDLTYLLRYLHQNGLIQYYDNIQPPSCTLTVEGHSRLVKLEKTRAASSEAFIAMWFDDSMNDALEKGFKPAISDAGYKPVRIDQREHPNKIDDEIIAGIRKARFVVADFTHGDKGERGGVYYEAGFAHGLDIPVYFTCREGSLEKIHFDTRQYNHIEWAKPEDLREALKNRITAHIGYGPHKPADE